MDKTVSEKIEKEIRQKVEDNILFYTGLFRESGAYAETDIRAIKHKKNGSILVAYYATYGVYGEYKTEEENMNFLKLVKEKDGNYKPEGLTKKEIEELENLLPD